MAGLLKMFMFIYVFLFLSKKKAGKQMTWTKESREKQSNRFINPFVVLNYKNEIVGVYRNSKQCERENEFGFSSMGIRNCLNNKTRTRRGGFKFKRISIEEYLEYIGEE
ncbi:hypothetical protein LKF67_0980 [Lactococcus lactis subsp. lactis]|uniref:hypothetical protein n=1 Tax=Lactococcus lactis TaxID=1358 RepID=UPI000727FDD6|nr:hypothetical protein [Lactococcus lactis]KST93236.1 hypothetical protein LKF67_0980 [Lactococcus lactis subsp. lactis]